MVQTAKHFGIGHPKRGRLIRQCPLSGSRVRSRKRVRAHRFPIHLTPQPPQHHVDDLPLKRVGVAFGVGAVCVGDTVREIPEWEYRTGVVRGKGVVQRFAEELAGHYSWRGGALERALKGVQGCAEAGVEGGEHWGRVEWCGWGEWWCSYWERGRVQWGEDIGGGR